VKKWIGIIVLLCFFLLTCRYLPYDKGLELGAQLIKNLKYEATIGPLSIPDLCYHQDDGALYFMPDKDSYSSGYIIHSNPDGHTDFWYVWNNPTSHGISQNPYHIYVTYASADKPNFFVETMADYPGNIIYVRFNCDSMGNQSTVEYQVIHYDTMANTWYATGENGLANAISTRIGGQPLINVNGVFINPVNNKFYALCKDSAGFVEAACTIETNGVTVATRTRSSSPADSTPLKDLWYNYDPAPGSTKAVISYIGPDGLHNLSWEGTSPGTAAQFPVDKPLFRILSNGNLLSFDNYMCYAYNLQGNKIYEFPTGNVRFIYEKTDPATGKLTMVYSIFTADFQNGDNCKGNYSFTVYSFLTEDLNY
jgi:hypothetical protein